MSLTKSTINNKYAVWALVIAAAIFGTRAYFSIPMQLFPDTAPPLVNIITAYPGASAGDVNETLSRIMEDEFASLEGVVKIKTSSQDNMSVISVEFIYDRDVDLAAVDVQNSIAKIRGKLPKGISEPRVLKFSTSDRPIISIGISAKDMVKARKMSEDIFGPQVQRVKGVAAVDVFGGHQPAVLVEINIKDVKAYKIPIERVVNTIVNYNSNRPAGQIKTEKSATMFRLESRSLSIKELKRIPITLPDGSRILLGDIADVKAGSLDDDARFAVNGKPAIAMQVFKTDQANTVDVVKLVEKKINELKRSYTGYNFEIGEESATFTEISVNNLLSNVWQALLFASVIVFLFLGRFKTSAVTIISMPLSYGLTFAMMHAFGVQFDMVTLSAVILAVGMVVDGTIVILDNITRRRDQEGLSPEDAAIKGTDEVRLAVLAGVATTLVVLIPLLFLSGFIGMTFGPLALTLIFAFTSSVIVALVLVPVLTLYTAKTGKIDHLGEKLVSPFGWVMDRIRDVYVATLKIALNHRMLTVFITLLMFAGSLAGISRLGMEVLPKMDGGSFFITIETPSGSSLDKTEAIVRKIESQLKKEPSVTKIQSQVGFEQGMRSLSSFGVQGPTQGFITVTLTNRTERDETIWDIEQRVREYILKIPGIHSSTVREMGNTAKSTTSAPIIVRLTGDDPLVLDALGKEVIKKIAGVPNVIEPTRNWRFDQQQALVKVDKIRSGQLGISPGEVATIMTMGSYGVYAGDFYGTETTPDPIHVSYKKSADPKDKDILDYPVFVHGSSDPVPLRAIATIEHSKGQGVITREDLAPTLEISAFSGGRALNFIIADVEKTLKHIVIPDGYTLTLTGEKSDLNEAKSELGSAFAVALIAVYLLLVAQLRSFLHPITIMVSIPLSLIGVFAALKIAGKPVSMPVMVGMILLAGTVVNNAIILIEFIRQKREAGVNRRKALVESVRTRFRPIMMTSLSTIVGMIPLAAEWALGSERFSPLATAVIGGMTAATMLTMIFIPVLYDLFDDLGKKTGAIFKRNSKSGVVIAIGLLIFSANVQAQNIQQQIPAADKTTEPSNSKNSNTLQTKLTLTQCIEIAKKNSSILKQHKNENLAAMYRVKQARGRFFPKLVGSAGYSRVKHVEPGAMDLQIPNVEPPQIGEAVDNRYFFKLSVEQPVFTGFALKSAYKTTKYAQDLASKKEQQFLSEITLQVSEAYFTLLKAKQLKEITSQSLKLLKEHKKQVLNLYHAGRAIDLDVSRVESRIASARIKSVQATGAVEGSRAGLATLLGFSFSDKIDIKDTLDKRDSKEMISEKELVEKAYKQRSELEIVNTAVLIANEKTKIAASGLWPQIGAKFGYIYSRPNQLYFPPMDEANGSWDVSVYLNWTLWDWGSTYNGMRAAKAEAESAKNAIKNVQDSIKIDVERRSIEYKTASQKIDAAKQNIDSTRQAYDNAVLMFDAGRLTSLDVLNAEFELEQAKFQLIDATADARIAQSRLKRATGDLK